MATRTIPEGGKSPWLVHPENTENPVTQSMRDGGFYVDDSLTLTQACQPALNKIRLNIIFFSNINGQENPFSRRKTCMMKETVAKALSHTCILTNLQEEDLYFAKF